MNKLFNKLTHMYTICIFLVTLDKNHLYFISPCHIPNKHYYVDKRLVNNV